MKNAPRDPFLPAHLTETQIVAYLDGELPRPDQEAARVHLENCWACRSRMSAVEESIEEFLGARARVLPEEASLGESRVEQFRQRLERHATESESAASSARRFTSWIHALRGSGAALLGYRQAIIACVVAICLVVLMFTDVLNPRVSADTVLLRSQEYETTHRPLAGRVNRTTVRVERVDLQTHESRLLGSITFVRDSETKETYVSARSVSGQVEEATVDLESIAEKLLHVVLSDDDSPALQQYLKSQEWVPDLSVAEFRRLVAARGGAEPKVQKQGSEFQLQYSFAKDHPSGIAEAVLLLGTEDYAPSQLSIVTTDQHREYQFTRLSFTSELRSPEMARMFASTATAHKSGPAGPELPSSRRPVPLSYAESHASEREVRISAALHKVDACLGEEVYVFPMSDGSLLVQGLVDSAARRQAIRDSLRESGGPLRIEVFVPRELRSGSELYSPPDQLVAKVPVAAHSANTATFADLSSANMPLYDRLYQHLSRPGASADDTQKQVAVFSNEVVTLARQSFLHAWALKRLDREFPGERTSGLSGSALREVEEMRQDHRRWIATLSHRQAELLAALAGPTVAAQVGAAETSDLDSEALLHLAEQQNELVRSLFTTTQQTPATDDSLAQLLAVLRRMGS